MSEELYKQMAQSIIEGEKEIAIELAKKSIELNMHPLDTITKGFVVGVNWRRRPFGTARSSRRRPGRSIRDRNAAPRRA